ncbi:hypothetical protein ACO0K9_27290, partial [Undibacterium sp. Ji50W]|uniref:hypothetical protein n=1 Tax=Undibacterium sp. Ji50W TaxID=3413041 RepID=UPI003BF1FDEC
MSTNVLGIGNDLVVIIGKIIARRLSVVRRAACITRGSVTCTVAGVACRTITRGSVTCTVAGVACRTITRGSVTCT